MGLGELREKGQHGKRDSTKGHGLKKRYVTSFSCCVTYGILGIILFDKAGEPAALDLHQSFPVNVRCPICVLSLPSQERVECPMEEEHKWHLPACEKKEVSHFILGLFLNHICSQRGTFSYINFFFSL